MDSFFDVSQAMVPPSTVSGHAPENVALETCSEWTESDAVVLLPHPAMVSAIAATLAAVLNRVFHVTWCTVAGRRGQRERWRLIEMSVGDPLICSALWHCRKSRCLTVASTRQPPRRFQVARYGPDSRGHPGTQSVEAQHVSGRVRIPPYGRKVQKVRGSNPFGRTRYQRRTRLHQPTSREHPGRPVHGSASEGEEPRSWPVRVRQLLR